MNNTEEIILQLLLGGLLGAVGQGLRVIVGMKKTYDVAQQQQEKFADLIVTSRLLLSLLIGFCAGLLAMLSISTLTKDFLQDGNTKTHLLAVLASGYAGTDFIEGLMKKYLPTNTPAAKPTGGQ
jgi:hypothetical protein